MTPASSNNARVNTRVQNPVTVSVCANKRAMTETIKDLYTRTRAEQGLPPHVEGATVNDSQPFPIVLRIPPPPDRLNHDRLDQCLRDGLTTGERQVTSHQDSIAERVRGAPTMAEPVDGSEACSNLSIVAMSGLRPAMNSAADIRFARSPYMAARS